MGGLPNFRERHAELRDRLSWMSQRNPRRRQLQAELRQLVRDELRAELFDASPEAPQIATDAPPSPVRAASDVPPGPTKSAAADPYGGHTPWWVDQ